MKNNRLILTIIFMAITFCFLMPTEVSAYNMVTDECLDKNECMLVCNYNNTYKGNNNSTRQRNISIYYIYKNKQWKLKWEGTNEDRIVQSKGPASFSNIFSNSGKNVYSEKNLSFDSFVCPKYGYLDMSQLVSDNELCFDDNGKYCENEKSNMGTAFGKKAVGFISKKKDYDVLEQVKSYFNKWILGDMPCSEFGEIDKNNVGTIMKEKVEKDFQTNFLQGQAIPKFILNSQQYTSNIEKGVEKKIKSCSAEIDEMQKKGEIDETTAERWKNNIQNLDPKDVQNAVDDARDKLSDDSNFDLSDYNQPQDCVGIFGDPTDKESLAYLIQTILNYIKVIGPILVVILSSFDFVKVIWTSDDENMKKAQQKLAKRLVAAVLLFLLPLLIDIMFNLINDSIVDPTCGIK